VQAVLDRRRELAPPAAIVGSVTLLTFAIVTQTGVRFAAPIALLSVVLATGHRALLKWPSLLTGIVIVIFFIPIKRYALPAGLPFSLEPYRLLIAVVAVAWLTSLMIDPELKLRTSGLEAPIAAFIFAAVASVGFNVGHIDSLGLTQYVVKTLTFFATFFILFYFVVSVIHTRANIDRLIRVIVGSGAIVAVAALIEYRTHDNLFNHVGQFLPFLKFQDPKVTAGLDASYLDRSGSFRAYASSAHPIELSAVLTMLIPFAGYLLKKTGERRWMLAIVVLVIGVFATLSRTGIVMLVVLGVVFFRNRPREAKRLLPALVPALLAVVIVLPHTLGSLYAQFFPKQGLVAQQSQIGTDHNNKVSDGRLADIPPSITEWSRKPLFGQGFGTRLTDSAQSVRLHVPLARILDDQWLSSLLETGIVGVIALLWLFRRSNKRMRRIARSEDGDDAWLATAVLASVTAFAVGMLTFDSLGFVQVTILLFLTLALGSALTNVRREESAAAASQPPVGMPVGVGRRSL
jgi:hypothetical protein